MFWLQLLQIIAVLANFAQIFGVVWVFLFGGKAAIDVVRDISRHQPIKVSAATIRNVLLALIFLALISSRFIPTPNSSPTPTSTPGETSGITTPTSTITTPMQLFPIDGSIFNNYPRTTKLIWEDTSQQVTYTIEIQFKTQRVDNNLVPISPEFFTDMVIVSKLNSQTSEYDFVFNGKTEGRWRIWAVDSSGHESSKSPWWTFTYTV